MINFNKRLLEMSNIISAQRQKWTDKVQFHNYSTWSVFYNNIKPQYGFLAIHFNLKDGRVYIRFLDSESNALQLSKHIEQEFLSKIHKTPCKLWQNEVMPEKWNVELHCHLKLVTRFIRDIALHCWACVTSVCGFKHNFLFINF